MVRISVLIMRRKPEWKDVKIILLESVVDPVAGKEGAEKHEIYVAAFGGHLFYDLFSQGQGPPPDPLL